MIDRWPVAGEHHLHILRRRPDRRWGRCPASTRLTLSESARLDALPSTVDPVLQSVTCELMAGHDGGHVAFAVASSGGDRWWWLRWAADLRELVELDTCERTQNNRPYRDECLLPQGHPGPHSFEVQATPSGTEPRAEGATRRSVGPRDRDQARQPKLRPPPDI